MAKTNLPIETLGSVLEQSLKRLDLVERLEQYAVWPIWNDVVGDVIARNAQPEKIRHGTLFVKVSSPVWMQQLQFMKDMIVGKVNHRLKSEVVKNIFFMVGRIDGPAKLPETTESNEATEMAGAKLNDEFLDSISDPDIRAAFGKLLRSYSRRRPKR